MLTKENYAELMNIQSTRRRVSLPPCPSSTAKLNEQAQSPFNDSWSVPRWISKPRSAISSANNLLISAQDLGWFQNPIPQPAQTTISALGAGFAVANIGAELLDGDLKGALWDVGNGVVSLTVGARLLGLSPTGGHLLFAGGALLNAKLAVEQLQNGEKVEGWLRMGNVAGLALSVAGGAVGGPSGALLGTAGLATRGVIGLAGLAHDLTDKKGFFNRPDRFS